MELGIQDAILKLSGVTTLEELRQAIQEALQLALPNTDSVIVYLLNPDTNELVSYNNLAHTLPREGVGWHTIESRQRQQLTHIDSSDPLAGLIQTKPCSSSNRIVLCSPVVEKEDDKVIAVLLCNCDRLKEADQKHLEFVEKQLSVCYKRIQRTLYSSRGRSQSNNNTLNQQDDILDLCASLNDQDPCQLQLKILKYIQERTGAKCSFLLLVLQETRELYCQVVDNRILDEEVRFQNVNNSFASVLETRRPITLADVTKEHRADLVKLTGSGLQSLLCVPVLNTAKTEVIAIACVANKLSGNRFTDADIASINGCFKYTSTILKSTLDLKNETLLKNQTQALLQVAKNLFQNLDDLTALLSKIMQEARNLTKAERCSVFLLEQESNELVAKVFDGQTPGMQSEIRLPATQGIAGHVATTGELLNIKDAYSHPLFYRKIDETTGFRTRNILCFPIKDEKGNVTGVAQLCNKLNGAFFTQFDEDIARAFGVYCCISIVHCLMYRKVIDAKYRSKLASDLMIYHMQVEDRNAEEFTTCKIPHPHSIAATFDRFSYTPRSIPESEHILSCLSMVEDLGFITKWRIHRNTLARFLLMVKKGYRDPPYHNWTHAFTVGHFCYLLIKNLKLNQYLDDVECLALFFACLCHDIDHRGTTNSFQMASQSVLASLYSSEGSVMERHHFAQTMCILNTEGCNIFENLNRKDYENCLDLVREIILATDLAHHLRIVPALEQMAKDGYNKANPRNKSLLLCLLMTSCDLSDQTKNWKNSRKIAELIYQEFFAQGDLEKALGQKPPEMMDRERAHIPELQIGFIDHIAYPVYKLVVDIFPSAHEIADTVLKSRRMWVKVNDNVKKLKRVSTSSMEVFDIDVEEDDNDEDEQQTTSNA